MTCPAPGQQQVFTVHGPGAMPIRGRWTYAGSRPGALSPGHTAATFRAAKSRMLVSSCLWNARLVALLRAQPEKAAPYSFGDDPCASQKGGELRPAASNLSRAQGLCASSVDFLHIPGSRTAGRDRCSGRNLASATRRARSRCLRGRRFHRRPAFSSRASLTLLYSLETETCGHHKTLVGGHDKV